ncbi:U32 family peptidase [Aromatoleum petrolei]|uniref:U32 family peptidase n=1 Tax=Aromatoleum petrolei TaxID=76116 RepID=A0ABX1MSN6_9RHOO|nr:U32 family peptidase [Aromatoleum petrolei]NMF89004.1 U32 family peptidase [Aromatoleum petrolei]QTQ34364.1 Peptidase, U32 family [Aromatoleum petrolei]
MRIVAPISRVEEVALLAREGANELYCGFVPDDWVGRFKVRNANRRPSGNLRSLRELEAAISSARQSGCTLSLVLNAQSYSDEQLEAAVEMGKLFIERGGDALIASDLGLISELSLHLPLRRIHVSSVATCRNGSAARLCRDLGASRLILPRDVTIEEACEIAAEVPDLETEVFILNDGCVFEEGACSTVHLPQRMGGPICLDRYVSDYRPRGARKLSVALCQSLRENDQEYEKWLWYRFSCGFTTNEQGMAFGPCGLCALPRLLNGGVAAVKIAGREAPTARKLASVRMVKAVLDRVEAGEHGEEIVRLAQNLRPSVEHCRTGYMCYYPEVLRKAVY